MSENLKILGWNCRGASGMNKLNRIRRLMKELKLDIVALVETQVDENRVSRFCLKFTKHWNWLTLTTKGFSGEIIILWFKWIGKLLL